MEHLWSQWLWRQAGGDDLEPLLEFLVVVNPFGLREGSARDGKAFHSDFRLAFNERVSRKTAEPRY
jgi:hypothetical protein